MRGFKAFLPIVVIVAAACRPATTLPSAELSTDQRASIETAVREAVDSLFEAMNARDAERILEHYVETDDFVYVGIVNPQFGRARLEYMVRRWAARDSTETVTHQVVHVQVLSPTVATVFSQGAFSTNEAGTAWTHVLVRGDDGRWRIVLEHEAWPAEVEMRGPHPM